MDLYETGLIRDLQLLHETVTAAAARCAHQHPLDEDHERIVQCSFQKREGYMTLGLGPWVQPQIAFLFLARRHLILLLLVKVMNPYANADALSVLYVLTGEHITWTVGH